MAWLSFWSCRIGDGERHTVTLAVPCSRGVLRSLRPGPAVVRYRGEWWRRHCHLPRTVDTDTVVALLELDAQDIVPGGWIGSSATLLDELVAMSPQLGVRCVARCHPSSNVPLCDGRLSCACGTRCVSVCPLVFERSGRVGGYNGTPVAVKELKAGALDDSSIGRWGNGMA